MKKQLLTLMVVNNTWKNKSCVSKRVWSEFLAVRKRRPLSKYYYLWLQPVQLEATGRQHPRLHWICTESCYHSNANDYKGTIQILLPLMSFNWSWMSRKWDWGGVCVSQFSKIRIREPTKGSRTKTKLLVDYLNKMFGNHITPLH